MGRKILLTLALAVLGTALAGVAAASGGSALPTPSTGGVGPGGAGGSGGRGQPSQQRNDNRNGNGGTKSPASLRRSMKPPPPRKPNGVPTSSNPTLTVAKPGPAPLGVPSFIISQFE